MEAVLSSVDQSFSTSSEGQWISLEGLNNVTALLRRTFDLTEVPVSAPLTITVFGYFELYVNGQPVGDRVLDPPLSNSARRVFQITHEVGDYLRTGRNSIALWLGRGWYRGFGQGESENMTRQNLGPLPGVIHDGPVVQLSLRLDSMHLVSDSSWRGAPGPILETGSWRNADFGGEIYDAKREISGWADPDFDDGSWEPVISIDVPSLVVTPSTVEPTRVLQSLPISTFEEIEPGIYQGDTGTCLTGWLELDFGPLTAGQEVVITYSDFLKHETFNPYHQEDRYRARGSGEERFCNRFNYHGFRWVRVQGARPLKGTAHLVGTDLRSVTSFQCSSERLNRIHAMVMHTLRCLSQNSWTSSSE